jgi:hypothetical protein
MHICKSSDESIRNLRSFLDVMMMDLGARTFASTALDREAVLERYREYPSDVPYAARSLIHICESTATLRSSV